jgi:flagellar biogenesis protein FliO
MTHSRHVRYRLMFALLCCCVGGLCHIATAEGPASAAVANASLGAETPALRSPVSDSNAASSLLLEQAIVRRPEDARASGAAAAKDSRWYRGTAVSLAVVLGLIGGGAWLLRRLMPQVRRSGGSGPVHVLSTTYLSPKQNLSLVRCGQRVILIGVTTEHISPLAVMDDQSEISLLMSMLRDGKDQPTGRFDEGLDRATGQFERTDGSFDEPLGARGRTLDSVGREVRGLLARVRSYKAGQLSG